MWLWSSRNEFFYLFCFYDHFFYVTEVSEIIYDNIELVLEVFQLIIMVGDRVYQSLIFALMPKLIFLLFILCFYG